MEGQADEAYKAESEYQGLTDITVKEIGRFG